MGNNAQNEDKDGDELVHNDLFSILLSLASLLGIEQWCIDVQSCHFYHQSCGIEFNIDYIGEHAKIISSL